MKRYSVILIPVLVIVALILLKVIPADNFSSDAARWAKPSLDQSNVITPEQLKKQSDNPLLVGLNDAKPLTDGNYELLNVTTESVLSKKNRQILRSHQGDIVLYADDPAVSARIWMVLSQMGYKQLYILAETNDNEVLKYKFRPDIATGPEL